MLKFTLLVAIVCCVLSQSGSGQKTCTPGPTAPCNAFADTFHLYFEAPSDAKMLSPVVNNRTEFLDSATKFFKEHYGLDYTENQVVDGTTLVWFLVNPENRYNVYSSFLTSGNNASAYLPLAGVKVVQEQIGILVLDPNGIQLGGHHNGTTMLLNQIALYGELKFISEATKLEVYSPMTLKTIHFIDVLEHGFPIYMNVEHASFGNGIAQGSVIFDHEVSTGTKYTIGSMFINFPGTLSEITKAQKCQKPF
jgi:hypothetical protein